MAVYWSLRAKSLIRGLRNRMIGSMNGMLRMLIGKKVSEMPPMYWSYC